MAHSENRIAGAPARLVFVPGFMQRGDAWRPVAERLEERYSTVLLDHRTHDFEGRVEEICEAARAGGAGAIRATVVGYSLGGRLALHAALRAPGGLAALVLVGASAGIEDPGERAARRTADAELAAWIERNPIADVVAEWERRPVLAAQRPDFVAAQRRGRLSHEPVELARLMRTAGQGALPPVWDRLGELGELPLLAIAGERDAPYVAAAKRIAAALPRGRALLVPGAGHAAHLERPDEVAAAIERLVEVIVSP